MKKTTLFFTLKLLLTVALLVVVYRFVDVAMVWQQLQATNPWLLAAAWLCVATGYVLCGLRWSWISTGLSLEVSGMRKIKLYFLGMFASLFLPSTIGGDVLRGILLAKGEGREGKGGLAAASVVLDRVNGLYALILLLTLSMFWFDWPPLWWGAWLLGVGLLWGGMFAYPWVYTHALERLPRVLHRWVALPLHESLFRSAWWKSFPISLVFQMLMVQAHFFLGMAVGLEMSWFAYSVMVGMVALVAILPISLNGFGVREAGYVGFVGYFGANVDAAAAMAALWVVVLALSALPGLWVLWRMGGVASLRQEK
ncbi:MAG: flippase-like domain-containing protein [Zetaproteobacteria bacterium]|nr:flippase-like domain-containing protein [Zetaproteobacteria bacterium]